MSWAANTTGGKKRSTMRQHVFASAIVLACGCTEPRSAGPAPAATAAATRAKREATAVAPPAVELDAGAPVDAAVAVASSPCPATPWSSYGHDPARTSASDGCVEGPLAITWKLT